MVLLNGAFQKSKNPLGLASTSLRSELTKPQQIFSTSAKLSSKSALICFIREGQDKYNKKLVRITPMQRILIFC